MKNDSVLISAVLLKRHFFGRFLLQRADRFGERFVVGEQRFEIGRPQLTGRVSFGNTVQFILYVQQAGLRFAGPGRGRQLAGRFLVRRILQLCLKCRRPPAVGLLFCRGYRIVRVTVKRLCALFEYLVLQRLLRLAVQAHRVQYLLRVVEPWPRFAVRRESVERRFEFLL